MKDIDGVLSIASKIWFNDSAGMCRLRICGFDNKQIEQLKNHGLCDIIITKVNEDKEHKNNRVYKIEAVMNIEKDNSWFNEVCWICKKEKLVHVDMRTTLDDPGFICKECEEYREDHERFMKDIIDE